MPELPEVETAVRQLRPHLEGRTVRGVCVRWPRTVARPSLGAFRKGLIGRRMVGLGRRGKFFIVNLDDGRRLVGHLRMSGRLLLGEEPDLPYARVSLALDDGHHLTFVDVRKFGRLALVRHLDEILPPLGPEPLSATVDGPWMAAALRQRRRMIKPLLLDQSFLAGLGNIYADEALHRAGLHPAWRSDRVPRRRAHSLVRAIQGVLEQAIEAGGSSFDAFWRSPEGQPGRFQDSFAVYGRAGQPCRRCRTPLIKCRLGQRGTHFCPRCQPPPQAGTGRG